jgi:hypothetical protein
MFNNSATAMVDNALETLCFPATDNWILPMFSPYLTKSKDAFPSASKAMLAAE